MRFIWFRWLTKLQGKTAGRARKKPRRIPLQVERLEPRQVPAIFTGGVSGAAGDLNGDGYPDSVTGAGPGGGPTLPSRELVFIDAAVSQAALLEAGVLRGAAVVELAAGRDGVQQIAAVLAQQHDLRAIHILSHGAPGEVDLGTARLDTATLPSYAASLRQWGQALAPGGDLLLYGCDVAAGSAGLGLVTQVAALTGSHVAASTDRTGAATLGGNWQLETEVGPVHTAGVIAAAAEAAYEHTLVAPFTDSGIALPGVRFSSVAWGDYDNDGKLDFLLTGQSSSGSISKVYHHNGNGTFSDSGLVLPAVDFSSVAWGDYDNDGKLDFLLTGNSGSGYLSKVYHNNGNGTFSDSGLVLPAVGFSSVAWGDYDNDGHLDFLLTGVTSSGGQITKLYHNQGNSSFSDSGLVLPGVAFSSVAWGDYDNDGHLDFLLTGETSSGYLSKVYHNNGNGTFSDSGLVLPGVRYSSVAWGDYDNDGKLDFLLTGYTGTAYLSKVYHNNGNGSFSDSGIVLPSVYRSSVAWGDYDNDGRLDFLLTGYTGSGFISKVYHNNGNGSFSDSGLVLPGVFEGSVAWGDYDNDGKLDFLLTGSTGGGLISKVYHNNAAMADTPPAAPTNLSVTATSLTSATLNWTGPSDGQTPTPGLSYALRVGTTPGGSDILSPLADTSTGFRRIQALGLVHTTSWTLTGLTPGQTYYWSVQAVDTSLKGGLFATAGRFHTIPPPPPPVTYAGTSVLSVSVAYSSQGVQVQAVVFASTQLWLYYPGFSTMIGSGVISASIAFTTSGTQILDVIYDDGGQNLLYSFVGTNPGQLIGGGATGVSITFDQSGGQWTAAVFQGTRYLFNPVNTIVSQLSNVLSTGLAFDSNNQQVEEIVDPSGVWSEITSAGTQFKANGLHAVGVGYNLIGQQILEEVFASTDWYHN